MLEITKKYIKQIKQIDLNNESLIKDFLQCMLQDMARIENTLEKYKYDLQITQDTLQSATGYFANACDKRHNKVIQLVKAFVGGDINDMQ